MPGMYGRMIKLYWGQTKAEVAFEHALCRLGIRYRFQAPIPPYFADFLLPDHHVVIEVDGDSHLRPKQIDRDHARDAALAAKGWKTVRITNNQVFASADYALELALKAANLGYLLKPQGTMVASPHA